MVYEERTTASESSVQDAHIPRHQLALLIVADISRRASKFGEITTTLSLRHLRSHFCTMHALGRAVRADNRACAIRTVLIGTLYESCPLPKL